MEPRNPKIDIKIQEQIKKETEKANMLYVDFVIDATSSMSSLYPAVYITAKNIVEWLVKYEVIPMIGMTLIRSLQEGEENEVIKIENAEDFTSDIFLFLKKLKRVKLYGGANDGAESIREALMMSLNKFPPKSSKVMIVFSDAYESKKSDVDLTQKNVGAVVFFCTEELSREAFDFSFMGMNGEIDEEGSPFFIEIEDILGKLSYSDYENIVKPLKDLVKGVSIGA
ncbi:MAG: hypothetical protein ACI4F9_01475 [Lachnospiraceae bacterium]